MSKEQYFNRFYLHNDATLNIVWVDVYGQTEMEQVYKKIDFDAQGRAVIEHDGMYHFVHLLPSGEMHVYANVQMPLLHTYLEDYQKLYSRRQFLTGALAFAGLTALATVGGPPVIRALRARGEDQPTEIISNFVGDLHSGVLNNEEAVRRLADQLRNGQLDLEAIRKLSIKTNGLEIISGDHNAIINPYRGQRWSLTQGLHGFSYNHAAIDIAGGAGTPIGSAINGVVTANFVDQYGNTTLVIENSRWTVTYLHGSYIVIVGQKLKIGQNIGTESNNGYTYYNGELCNNRPGCGNHTHLNIYDKNLGANANPLVLLGI